jgi:hypothetical protein
MESRSNQPPKYAENESLIEEATRMKLDGGAVYHNDSYQANNDERSTPHDNYDITTNNASRTRNTSVNTARRSSLSRRRRRRIAEEDDSMIGNIVYSLVYI